MESPTTTVVIEERRRRRGGAFWIAGAAATALLLGGSTYALWQATDTFAGGTITAGDLNVVETDNNWYDVSADRLDQAAATISNAPSIKAHAISDIDTYRIVPGDKIALAIDADVTLVGDNLVADLAIDGLSQAAGTPSFGNNGAAGAKSLTYTYAVYQEGTEIVSESALPTGNGHVIYFESNDAGQAAGGSDAKTGVLTVGTSGTDKVTVVIFASFDATVDNRLDVTAKDVLSGATLKLTQTRTEGAQYK